MFGTIGFKAYTYLFCKSASNLMKFPCGYLMIIYLDECMQLLRHRTHTQIPRKDQLKVFVSYISGSSEMQQQAESSKRFPINKERKCCAAHSSRNSTQIISNQFVWLMPQLFARTCNKIRTTTTGNNKNYKKAANEKILATSNWLTKVWSC